MLGRMVEAAALDHSACVAHSGGMRLLFALTGLLIVGLLLMQIGADWGAWVAGGAVATLAIAGTLGVFPTFPGNS